MPHTMGDMHGMHMNMGSSTPKEPVHVMQPMYFHFGGWSEASSSRAIVRPFSDSVPMCRSPRANLFSHGRRGLGQELNNPNKLILDSDKCSNT